MQFGLIGETLSHSYSVEIHNKISSYNYELKEVKKQHLKDFIKSKDFLGINVTIPYKEAVIPHLDEISENAKIIGAVNTIVNKDGKLLGYNTDYFGMISLIKHKNIEINEKKVLILGTGGTSKTAYYVAKSLNAQKVLLVSRTKKDNVITYEEAATQHNDAEIIINTTPCGMYPNIEQAPIDITKFPKLTGVIDAIYNPISSRMISTANQLKIKSSGGLYMLVAQAVFASSLFFDKKIDTSLIDKVYKEIKSEKQNIVLIGMPSCGKSTIGKLLSNTLNRPFFDTDEEIVKTKNKPITKIFEEEGEVGFRKTESEVIASLSKKSGIIIATGGGSVLNNDNILSLKQNGVLVFIDRALENLIPTPDRPLSSQKSSLQKMYFERLPIYKNIADICIDGNSTLNAVADKIRKEIL